MINPTVLHHFQSINHECQYMVGSSLILLGLCQFLDIVLSHNCWFLVFPLPQKIYISLILIWYLLEIHGIQVLLVYFVFKLSEFHYVLVRKHEMPIEEVLNFSSSKHSKHNFILNLCDKYGVDYFHSKLNGDGCFILKMNFCKVIMRNFSLTYSWPRGRTRPLNTKLLRCPWLRWSSILAILKNQHKKGISLKYRALCVMFVTVFLAK